MTNVLYLGLIEFLMIVAIACAVFLVRAIYHFHTIEVMKRFVEILYAVAILLVILCAGFFASIYVEEILPESYLVLDKHIATLAFFVCNLGSGLILERWVSKKLLVGDKSNG